MTTFSSPRHLNCRVKCGVSNAAKTSQGDLQILKIPTVWDGHCSRSLEYITANYLDSVQFSFAHHLHLRVFSSRPSRPFRCRYLPFHCSLTGHLSSEQVHRHHLPKQTVFVHSFIYSSRSPYIHQSIFEMQFSSAVQASAVLALTSRSLSGEATFYGGNTAGGTCSFSGYTLPSGIYGTALTSSSWDDAANCGACVAVTGPSGTVITAMVCLSTVALFLNSEVKGE